MKKNVMKKIIPAAMVFALALEAYSLPQKNALSQKDYVELVRKNNKDLKIAKKSTMQSLMQVNEAVSAILPTVGIMAGYTRNLCDVEKETMVGVYPITVNYKGNTIQPGCRLDEDSNFDNEIQVGLSADWNIFSPTANGRIKIAKKNYSLNKAAEELTEEKLVLGAKRLYAQVQLLNAVVNVQKEVAETAESVYRNQEKKYKAGTITELDMRMAEVDWKNRLTDVAVAQKNARLGEIALKTLAAVPLTDSLSVEDMDSFDKSKIDSPEEKSFESVLSASTEYQVMILAKEIADSQFNASLAAYLPSVSGNFTMGYGQFGGYEGKDDWNAYNATSASLGVRVTLPLITGGYRIAANKETYEAKEKAKLKIEQKRDELERDFADAKLRLEEAALRIDSAAALETAANRAATLASSSLANGLGTQVAVSQAESQLAQAKLSMQNAIYEYRSAFYDLEYLYGEK